MLQRVLSQIANPFLILALYWERMTTMERSDSTYFETMGPCRLAARGHMRQCVLLLLRLPDDGSGLPVGRELNPCSHYHVHRSQGVRPWYAIPLAPYNVDACPQGHLTNFLYCFHDGVSPITPGRKFRVCSLGLQLWV